MAEILRALEPEQTAGFLAVGYMPKEIQQEAAAAVHAELMLMKDLYGSCAGEAIYLLDFPERKLQAYLAYVSIEIEPDPT